MTQSNAITGIVDKNMNRAIDLRVPVFLFSLIAMLCLGLIYGWSIFVVPLENEFGWERSETSLTFTISMMSLTIGVMLGGQFNKKKDKAFVSLIVSAALLCFGFIATSRAEELIHFYLFYGVCCGFGVGFAYVEMIAVLTKWFPGKQGLSSGLLMMCFGMGAMILGTICSSLMTTIGWRTTFLILGGLSGALVFIDGALIQIVSRSKVKNSTQQLRSDENSLTSKEMIRASEFKALYIWLMFISAAGLALMGHIAPCAMQMGADAAMAAFISGLVSVSNGGGRIIYGIIYDKISVKTTMFIIVMVFVLAAVVTLAAVIVENIFILIIGSILIGMSFGSAPTSSSAIVNRFYGPRYFSANFGIISSQLVVAALIGPFMAGKLYTATGGYTATFYGVFGLSILSVIIVFLVQKFARKNKRNLEKYQTIS